MVTNIAASASLEALTSELGVTCPQKPPSTEHSSSLPPLIGETSSILEDGEVKEQQDPTSSLQGELQVSSFEYSTLQDRYNRLERQHNELQDLASAYSEVIRGSSSTADHTVSIDQLQAEAGRGGLRAKALESDVLRPLVREAGGLQALMSQLHTARRLIEKAGGPRELEQFVSDVRSIRDTLNEVRCSRGLAGLVTEVRDLLQTKQNHDRLAFEVDRPTGLRSKAAKYDKLAQAFLSLPGAPASESPLAGNAAMNPDRARMISATPLEADPDRDLYEAPPPVAQPNNRTGSNNTPLGVPQEKLPDMSSKRKDVVDTFFGVSAKRPRVDVGRAAALLQMSLPTTTNSRTDQIAEPRDALSGRAGIAGVKARAQTVSVQVADPPQRQSDAKNKQDKLSSTKAQPDVSRVKSLKAKTDVVTFEPRTQTTPLTHRTPDWMRSNVHLKELGFASMNGNVRNTFTPLTLDAEPHTEAIWEPRTPPVAVSSVSALLSKMLGRVEKGHTDLQATKVSINPDHKPALTGIGFLTHEMAFWVGASHASATWEPHQLSDLKRGTQIPSDLGAVTFKLVSFIRTAEYDHDNDKMMFPSHGTCILGCLIDGHGPSELAQERTACRMCTQNRRPCALMQEIEGKRVIVFMPLRAEFRRGRQWSEEAFWIQDMQERA